MQRRQTKMLSKNDLLLWLKQFVNVSSGNRIEALGNGVVYCQLLRHFHPHAIPEPSILKEPKNEYENMSNLKLLQTGLVKLKTSKEIDIAKLAKCRYQDNWELLSWLHGFFTEPHEEDYFDETATVAPVKFSGGKRDHHTFVQQKENFLYNRCSVKGKSSVSSELFRNDYSVIVERAKDILMKAMGDSEKVRQLKLLLGVPLIEPSSDLQDSDMGLEKLFELDAGHDD